MSGYESHNFPAFDAAAEFLREQGFEVVSPADLTRKFFRMQYGREFNPSTDTVDEQLYRELLSRDLAALAKCDGLAVLDGWLDSRGARIEVAVAVGLGFKIIDASTGLGIDGIDVLIESEEVEAPADESPIAEANRVVNGERARFYGHPLDNHGNTADLWRCWLSRRYGVDIPLDAESVGWLMILLKASREANAPKHDNLVDVCGYAENVHMIRTERARRANDSKGE